MKLHLLTITQTSTVQPLDQFRYRPVFLKLPINPQIRYDVWAKIKLTEVDCVCAVSVLVGPLGSLGDPICCGQF